ncbi:hypothetical protein BH23PLA1_BH23PLA1_28200 [soil metagenome]
MTWLSENPWPLVGTFGVLALAFLIALRVAQQGRFLIWAGVCAALALMFWGIEQLWVTDRERIEAVVYDLADAVKQSDYDRIIAHLDPDEFDLPGGAFGRATLRSLVESYEFEFVRISNLEVDAGQLSRRGKADFTAQASYRTTTSTGGPNYGLSPVLGWSIGFREVEPKVWKVTRIDLTRTPQGISTENVMRYIGR